MKATGIVRKVDELGVLSCLSNCGEIWILMKRCIEIYVDEDKIILKKV